MKRAYTIERNELICDLYRNGKTIEEIAESMSLSAGYVDQIICKAHIRPTSLAPEAVGLIVDMLSRGGASRAEIAKAAGCSVATVTNYARKIGFTNLKKKFTPAQIEEMSRLRYEEGLNNTAIAERFGTTVDTVSNNIGLQPKEMSEIYKSAGARIRGIRQTAERKAKIAMRRLVLEDKRKQEAARLEAERIERERLEAERIERERIEALRAAKETEIRELLSSLGIPSENFTIDSAESGDAFLSNLITRATEKLSVGA